MTWNEICKDAENKGIGDFALKRKDNAIYDVVCFVEDNFGFNIENENGFIDYVEDYIERFNITFNEEGRIDSCSHVSTKDKANELLSFYNGLSDRRKKEFDALGIALKILKEYVSQ